jgi:hypothetical protein
MLGGLSKSHLTEEVMKEGKTLLSSCVAIIFSAAIAQAGPCNTGNKDAGSGPTPGHTTQTIGAAPASQH